MDTILSHRKYFFERIKFSEQKSHMSFIDHLEVLRWHIIRAAIAIVIAAAFIFIFINWIFDNVVYAPARMDFITYTGLCNFGHTLHLGNSLCMPPVHIPLLGSTVSGPFMSAISIALQAELLLHSPTSFGKSGDILNPH
ncbi:MAG TPA: twin-arginine translocase subunit TatC [Chitinophagaceae bacterium]|nr:twin-arginine translocase subunit TatC [Chitinophagaceae bacterium]